MEIHADMKEHANHTEKTLNQNQDLLPRCYKPHTEPPFCLIFLHCSICVKCHHMFVLVLVRCFVLYFVCILFSHFRIFVSTSLHVTTRLYSRGESQIVASYNEAPQPVLKKYAHFFCHHVFVLVDLV